MYISDYAVLGNFNNKLKYLANMTDENWDSPEQTNGILKYYVGKTFEKVYNDNQILETENYAIFNTGLFTPKLYEPIYAYFIINKQQYKESKWYLEGFYVPYNLRKFKSVDVVLPKRANYFQDPSLLVFDTSYNMDIQVGHILKDPENISRFPAELRHSPYLENTFTGALGFMIKRVEANYKLAVPQYYKGGIQLLLPLSLDNTENVHLALVVSKMSECYRGSTCLTLDMAYQNARLIAKPESNWLQNSKKYLTK